MNGQICISSSLDAGERTCFPNSSIRLGVVFSESNDQMHFSAEFTTLNSEPIVFDIVHNVEIKFINQTDTKKLASSGGVFDIYEGAKKIGTGRFD
ncbi:hypothetical protein [Ponticaulis profundi]|uniref:Uncharacterized protein n=1 Tax=Ponticaulis profundi TaxID=2665222 RepID=A0ABW1S893_9PROT